MLMEWKLLRQCVVLDCFDFSGRFFWNGSGDRNLQGVGGETNKGTKKDPKILPKNCQFVALVKSHFAGRVTFRTVRP